MGRWIAYIAWLRNIIIVDVWEIRKHIYIVSQDPVNNSHSQSSPGDLAVAEGQFPVATVVRCKEHLVVMSLTYVSC